MQESCTERRHPLRGQKNNNNNNFWNYNNNDFEKSCQLSHLGVNISLDKERNISTDKHIDTDVVRVNGVLQLPITIKWR
jgi:hypothetical protein